MYMFVGGIDCVCFCDCFHNCSFSIVFFVSRFINTVYDYDRMYVASIHTAMNLNTGTLYQHKYIQHNTKIL
jgi:hypothetical protein